jgi:hypothetical protein
MPFDGKIELFTKTNPVADVLRRAKALIDSPEKWGKGRGLCNPKDLGMDALCALTAVSTVTNGRGHWRAAVDALERSAGKAVYLWNDRPETTHADIMAGFDKAIALAEQE